MSDLPRGNRSRALVLPILLGMGRRVQGAGLFLHARLRLPIVQLQDGTRRILGRLSDEESRSSAGDLLVASPESSPSYRSLSLGAAWRAHTQGIVAFEEFIGAQTAVQDIGTLPWDETALSGTVTILKVSASETSQRGRSAGVVRLLTDASSSTGSVIHLGGNTTPADDMGMFPFAGRGDGGGYADCVAKLRLGASDTQLQVWAGIWSEAGTYPDSGLANTISGIGFGARAGGSAVNWFGIVRSGTSESTVDLGVAADTTWYELAWRYDPGLMSVQFYVDGVATGSAVSTNLPADGVGFSPMFGIVTTDTSAKLVDIDYLGLFLDTGDRV